jgi:hypothetical protein
METSLIAIPPYLHYILYIVVCQVLTTIFCVLLNFVLQLVQLFPERCVLGFEDRDLVFLQPFDFLMSLPVSPVFDLLKIGVSIRLAFVTIFLPYERIKIIQHIVAEELPAPLAIPIAAHKHSPPPQIPSRFPARNG